MKQIEQITEEDLMEVWPAIGGTPHLFEYGKDELKQVLTTGECEGEDGEPIGLQLDYYTMAAIVDTLRKRGYETGGESSSVAPLNKGEETEKELKIILGLFERFMPAQVSMTSLKEMAMYEAFHRIKALESSPVRKEGEGLKEEKDNGPEGRISI